MPQNTGQSGACGFQPSGIAAIDAACDAFEQEWAQGRTPRLESFLGTLPDTQRDRLFRELLAIELWWRGRRNEPALPGEYHLRFPGERDAIDAIFVFRNGPGSCESGRETAMLATVAVDTNCESSARIALDDFLTSILAPADRAGDIGRLGDYQIISVLGTGGMGIVLNARDPKLDRNVAIKLMRPEAATIAGAKERFVREARLAAAVEHPRIVIIYHVGEWNGTPYLVMPVMSGSSLAARLKKGPSIGLVEAVRFVREAADGLTAAHARGLIHRDIKPDNIWLEEMAEGTHVRLLDFGLARTHEGELLTQPGRVLGTPNYMAPEQAAGETVDARADLFSLGCVLYEVLTGRKPFAGNSVMAVLSALANHKPPPPREVLPTVPVALSDLTMRLMNKTRERRPASAAVVTAELRRIEADQAAAGDTLRPGMVPSPVPTEVRRIPKWAWVVSAVVVAGFIGWTVWSQNNGGGPDASGVARNPEESRSATTVPSEQIPIRRQPLRVTSIDIQHFAHLPEGDVPRGVLGQSTFTTSLGDHVQVTARLSKPGYAYLIAFRPDGVADLCFPHDQETPPPLTDMPRYPQTDGRLSYGLREGTGLWVFAAVVSEDPLPAYREWLQQKFTNDTGWQPVTKLPTGIVWRDDGSAQVELLTASGVKMIDRGKDELLEGPAEAIRDLTYRLRWAGGVTTVSTIGFAVTPK